MTSLLVNAINYAAIKHRDQRRKDQFKSPYINHPIDVVNWLVLAGYENDQELLAAAVLHDTIEDTGTSYEELATVFGKDIADIVMECTDNKKLDKITRKKEQIKHAAVISKKAKLVKLADKLSNMFDLQKNPPLKWTPAEIHGYFVWSLHVIREMKGTNAYLENELNKVLMLAGVLDLTENELDTHLQEYYKNIKNSE